MSNEESVAINGKPVTGYELRSFVSKMVKKAGASFDVSDTIKSVIQDWKTDADWEDILSCHGGVNGEEIFVVPPDQAGLLAEILLMEDYPKDFDRFCKSLFSSLALTEPPKRPKRPAKSRKNHVLLETIVEDEAVKSEFTVEPQSVFNQLVGRREQSLYLQDLIKNFDSGEENFEVAQKRETEIRKHLQLMHGPNTSSIDVDGFVKKILRGLPEGRYAMISSELMMERGKNPTLAMQMTYRREGEDGSIFAVLKEDWTAFGDFLIDKYGKFVKHKKKDKKKAQKKEKPKPIPETVVEPAPIQDPVPKVAAEEEVVLAPWPAEPLIPPPKLSFSPKPVKSSQSTPQARPRSNALPTQPTTGLHWAVLSILDKKGIGLNPYLVENSILNRKSRNPLLQEIIFLRGKGRDEEHIVLDARLGYLEDFIVKEYGGSVPNLESGSTPKPVEPKPEAHELSDDQVIGLYFAISGILTREKIGLNPLSVKDYVLSQRRHNSLLEEMIFKRVWGADRQFVIPKGRIDELKDVIVKEYGRPEQRQQRKERAIPLLTLIEGIFGEEGIKEDSFAAAETLLSRRASEFQVQKMMTKVEGSGNPPSYAVLPENQAGLRKLLIYSYGSPKTTGLDEFVADVFKILRNRFELSDLRQTTLDREQKRVVFNLMQERKKDSGLADMIPYCDREPGKSIYRVFEEDAESLQKYIIEYIKELKQVRKHGWQHKKKPSAARPPRHVKPVLLAKPDREIDEPDADTIGIVRALKSARSPTYEPATGNLKSEGDDFEIELDEFVSELISNESMDASVDRIVSDLVRRMKKRERPLTSLIKEHDTKTHEFAYGVEDDKSQGLREYIIRNYAANKIALEGTTSVLDACRLYIGRTDPDVEEGMIQIVLAAVGGNKEFSESVIFPAKKDYSSWRVRKGKITLFLQTLNKYDLPYHRGKIQPSMKARAMIGKSY
jgi:hypothetical protein